jgi:hypothetical protein
MSSSNATMFIGPQPYDSEIRSTATYNIDRSTVDSASSLEPVTDEFLRKILANVSSSLRPGYRKQLKASMWFNSCLKVQDSIYYY